MPYTPTAWANLTAPYLEAANLNKIEQGLAATATLAESGGGGSANPFGIMLLDSFTGATDDDKLTTAIATIAPMSYKPYIGLSNRKYIFSGARGRPYDGFGMVGIGRGWPNNEIGVHHTEVQITVSGGPWLTTSGDTWNWYFEGISFIGGGTTTQFLRALTGNTLWGFTGHNLSFQNFKGIFGNSTEQCVIDLCSFTGPWSALTPLSTQFNLGGADNRQLWDIGLNIGGGTSGPVNNGGGGDFLIKLRSLSKTTVGPVYLTADNAWRGILCTGSSASGTGLILTGVISEGRNPADPCDGNLIRVEGGAVTLRDVGVNCGMANPAVTAAANANAIADRGLIECLGTDTQVVVDGLTVAHATGVAIDTPVLVADGSAKVRVRNVMTSTRSGSPAWGTQLPVVRQTATGKILDRDTSNTLVTAP